VVPKPKRRLWENPNAERIVNVSKTAGRRTAALPWDERRVRGRGKDLKKKGGGPCKP